MRERTSFLESLLRFLMPDVLQALVIILIPGPMTYWLAHRFGIPFDDVFLPIIYATIMFSYLIKASHALKPIKTQTFIAFCDRWGWRKGILAAACAQMVEYGIALFIFAETLAYVGLFEWTWILVGAIIIVLLPIFSVLVALTYFRAVLLEKSSMVIDINNKPILPREEGDLYIFDDLTHEFIMVKKWRRGDGVVTCNYDERETTVPGYRTMFIQRRRSGNL